MKYLDKLRRQYAAGSIDRRQFMMGALATGLTVPAALSLAGKVEAATPKRGGRMRQAVTGGGTSDVLDPAQTLDSYMINVSFGQLRNCLTEIAPDGSLIGEVAESWEATPDAATWVFKVRKGMEFHNGKTVTPEDVAASINHHRGESSKSAAKGLVDPISDIKVDGNTVVFTLSGANADFPYLMSDYHLTICPANSDGSMDWQSGIGSGAYMLDSFEPGVRTLTKRHPNYWKSDRAFFDEVETLFVADSGARTSALQTDEIDVITNLDLKTIHLMARDASLNVFQTTGNKHATLPMLCDVAPFDNNHVRMALKLSFKREEWLKTILKGYGEVGNDFPIGPANQYRATEEEIPQRVYDPEKAKWHLKQAGMENLTVEFSAASSAFEGAVDAAQLYAESAKAAGIDLKVVREADDGYWSNVWLVKPWVASYWGGRPTEDWMFSQVYAADAAWNETHWKNPRFNELLVQARAELNDSKRREMYVEMQRLVHDDGGAIVPLFMAYTHAANKKIGLPDQLANNWELDGHRNAERWWFS